LAASKEIKGIKKLWLWWRWILTGLNSLALVLSVIMSWHYLKGGSMVGCGGGSPCEEVLNSQWSTIAGVIPISGLAVGVYLAMLVASLFIGADTDSSVRRLAWRVMLILAGAVAGSAIWFTVIQKWIIGDFCPYCMATHITGVLLASLIIWRAIVKSEDNSIQVQQKNHKMIKKDILPAIESRIVRPLQAVGLALIGLLLAGSLAAFQVVLTPSAALHDGESQDKMPAIDYHEVPVVGSADAPYIFTVLFDYQCPHCQRLHFSLDEVIRRYSGKVAFALAPVPLNPHCNPYIPQEADAFKNSCELARIGLAVWLAKRDAFSSLLEATMAKAVELVGQAELDAAMTSPWIDQYLQTCVQIYGKTFLNGKGGVPKLIYGSRWILPETYGAEDLILILQNSFDVPKP